ncbi:hypothetical protein GTO27_08275 [Candidatus Bathyarchaeota archaeon]|nr:hypothetical protein [Candidatus Bathyarchaeota archaeon]
MGKLSTEDLKKLLKYVKRDPRLVVPPLLGFDSGVHLMDDKYMVVSTDPCVGVPLEWFGWLLVHYPASDTALFGAKPEFCTMNLLAPPSTGSQVFYSVMKQACDAAEELGIAVVTGHTGTYRGLSTLVGTCAVYGTVAKEKLITPGQAEPGDLIVCVKPIGLEIAVNFALTHKALAERLFGVGQTGRLARLVKLQSCVREALILAEMVDVHAMHDATEGGLAAALNEMAEASEVGFKMKLDNLMIPEEVEKLRKSFQLSDLQVLSMSSTGTIVAAVSPGAEDKIQEVLGKEDVKATILGCFTKNRNRILIKNGKETPFPRKTDDPYERIMEPSDC